MKSKTDIFEKIEPRTPAGACMIVSKSVNLEGRYSDQTRPLCVLCKRKLADLEDSYLSVENGDNVMNICEDCAFLTCKAFFSDIRCR